MTKVRYSQRPESEPADSFAGIPALQVVLDPCQLGSYLDPILAPQWGMLRDIQIRVLKHHRGSRCTIEITLETKAVHCLRRAKNDLRLDSGRMQTTEAMLDEGLRILADDVKADEHA